MLAKPSLPKAERGLFAHLAAAGKSLHLEGARVAAECLDTRVAELDGPGLHIGLERCDLLVPFHA